MESEIIIISDNSRPVDFGSDDLVAAVNFSSDEERDPSDPQVLDVSSEKEVDINSQSDMFEYYSGGSGLINEDDEIFFRSGEDHPAEDLLNRLEFDESTQTYTDDDVRQSIAALSAIKAAKYSFSEIEGKFLIIGKIGEGTFSSVYKARSLTTPNGFVALKRLYPTSTPQRILSEIKLLQLLGGKCNVVPLLGGFRDGGQVTLVMPYFSHDSFKDFMSTMDAAWIKKYMRALLTALDHLHQHKVMHRDIKPGNFLYSRRTDQFLLVDFGLAHFQLEDEEDQQTKKRKREDDEEDASRAAKRQKLSSSQSRLTIPTPVANDPNQKKRIPARAGTRGFRAPEVLLRCIKQTTAIDVWSAGVILLSILSGRYPFFQSPDDMAALAELAMICGTKEIIDVGQQLNRKVSLNFHAPKSDWKQLCSKLRGNSVLPISDDVYNLLSRCLDINPNTRITAGEALKHKFLIE
jgi:cell division control protein 7